MMSLFLFRFEPDILLRAKQEFMKTDSATDLEWVFSLAIGNSGVIIHWMYILSTRIEKSFVCSIYY